MGLQGGNMQIAVIGGNRRWGIRLGRSIRHFPSSREGGNGTIRAARDAIQGGAFDLVLFLVRWLGHPEFDALVSACRSAHVPHRIVTGGLSAARRSVQQVLAASRRRHFGHPVGGPPIAARPRPSALTPRGERAHVVLRDLPSRANSPPTF